MAMPLAAYGVFLPVLAEAFGWSRGAVSTALSINLVIGGLAGFGIGALADRYGPRVMLVLTVALAGAAFALVSQVHALWQIYLFVGILGGVGTSSFYLLSTTTIARWFAEQPRPRAVARSRGIQSRLRVERPARGVAHRGDRLARGLCRAGRRRRPSRRCSVRCRCACRARAEHTAPVRPDRAAAAPARIGGITLRQALADRRQWYLNACWLLQGGLVFMVTVHIVPFARDQGVSLAGASLALTAYGIGAFIGRLVGGVTSDRLGTLTTVRAAYIAMALAMVVLVWVPSRVAMLGSMAAFGAGFAAADTMIAKVIPDVFGLRAIGAIMGMLTLGWRAGAALGPAAAGFLFDLTGSYTIPFGAAPFAVLASWMFFTLGTYRSRTL